MKGWLEARDVEVTGSTHNGSPLLTRPWGRGRPTIVLHGHLDVVPDGPTVRVEIDGDASTAAAPTT